MISTLLSLFFSFLQVGAFSFGGGMAAMPLIQAQVVDLHGWITLSEFTDLVTIAEMTPGPIAINGATFVGIQVAGIPGALVATLGCVLPSFFLVVLLARAYERYGESPVFSGALSGLRPGVVALIACAGMRILIMALWGEGGFSLIPPDWMALALIVISFLVLRKWKPSPILIMVASGLLGGAVYLIREGL